MERSRPTANPSGLTVNEHGVHTSTSVRLGVRAYVRAHVWAPVCAHVRTPVRTHGVTDARYLCSRIAAAPHPRPPTTSPLCLHAARSVTSSPHSLPPPTFSSPLAHAACSCPCALPSLVPLLRPCRFPRLLAPTVVPVLLDFSALLLRSVPPDPCSPQPPVLRSARHLVVVPEPARQVPTTPPFLFDGVGVWSGPGGAVFLALPSQICDGYPVHRTNG